MVVSFGTGLPKMSETLVAFAEPLLAGVPEAEEGYSRLIFDVRTQQQSGERVHVMAASGLAR